MRHAPGASRPLPRYLLHMPTPTPPIPAETLANWRHHLQDEADAAFLYRVLAGADPSPKGSDIYRRLAEVEDRHAGLWRQVLAEHGVEVATPAPSTRARFLAWTARVAGPGLLLPMLVREEGQEVKGYLDLYRETGEGSAKDAALMLAKESAEHAQTLGQMAGAEGEPWHHANFGLVAGVIGAEVAPHIILVSGLAGMIADALSMGSSGYLAAKSEQEVYAHEIAMEREEIQMMPEVEEEELALLYEAKGVEGER